MSVIDNLIKARVEPKSLLPQSAQLIETERRWFEEGLALRHKAALVFENKDAEIQYEVVIWGDHLHEVESVRGNDLRKCLEKAKEINPVRMLYAFANIGEISVALDADDEIFQGFHVTRYKDRNVGPNPRVVWTTKNRGHDALCPAEWKKVTDI